MDDLAPSFTSPRPAISRLMLWCLRLIAAVFLVASLLGLSMILRLAHERLWFIATLAYASTVLVTVATFVVMKETGDAARLAIVVRSLGTSGFWRRTLRAVGAVLLIEIIIVCAFRTFTIMSLRQPPIVGLTPTEDVLTAASILAFCLAGAIVAARAPVPPNLAGHIMGFRVAALPRILVVFAGYIVLEVAWSLTLELDHLNSSVPNVIGGLLIAAGLLGPLAFVLRDVGATTPLPELNTDGTRGRAP